MRSWRRPAAWLAVAILIALAVSLGIRLAIDPVDPAVFSGP